MDSITRIKTARVKFIAMAISYCLGVFNDNYFKQAAMLLAVAAGLSQLQGTATVLFALPFILFSSWAGWMADRFPKRSVVIWSKAMELVAMLIGAAGAITGNWFCILSMVFLMGTQSALFSPALNGSIPELYPAAYVPRANAILKLMTTLSILLGIATAGISLDRSPLHFGSFKPGTLLVALVVVLVAALGLVASFGVHSRPAATKDRPFPLFGPLSSIKDILTICADRHMLIALFADNFFYFLATIVVLTINTMGLKQLAFSQTATSLLSVSLMLGVCVGSLLAARLVTLEKWSRFLYQSAIGMAAGLLLAGATVLLPVSIRLVWIAAALAATGIFGGLFLIPVASYLQVRPADCEKGKVLATVNFSGFIGIMLAGTVFTGLDMLFSPAGTMLCLGVFTLIAAWAIHQLKKPGFNPIPSIFQNVFRLVLSLRYRIEVTGLANINREEGKGILFLPNHQALIDPVIVMSVLYPAFQPRPLADADQANMPGNRWIMQQVRPITLPDLNKNGRDGKTRIKEALQEVAGSLRTGENILLYPSGRLCRSAREDMAGNSGVEYLLENVPGVRTVLVRITGLWGSTFSWGRGTEPSLHKNIGRILRFLCANVLFFGPRRQVMIELVENTHLPKIKGRQQINSALEEFYNAKAQVNSHVPYYWWQGRTPEILPEPQKMKVTGDLASVPEASRRLVMDKISQLVGRPVSGEERLANDLAVDSLALMELATWLESEFGLPVDDLSALATVNDCILAAAGQSLQSAPAPAKPLPDGWFEDSGKRLSLDRHKSITDLFLAQAKRSPKKIILADQLAGEKTYRQVLTAILVLKPVLEKVPGERIGIMLPASVSGAILYLATLFSGKTPVMINWTTGSSNIRHGMELTGVTTIVSARALYKKLTGQGIDLETVGANWLFLDEIVPKISMGKKIRAALHARFAAHSLDKVKVSKTATILFTSGSEARPKAVPLTHANIIANLRDFSSIVSFTDEHRLLGMLPPFHSLGLVGTIILPLCLGLKTVYHANPTESAILAGLIERYRVSIVIGTPTFLLGIIKAASSKQLQSLRLVFTGAEKCPEPTHQALKKINPSATLCEGYGITECSPLVSINRVEDPRPGTIGRVMPSMEYAIIDPETNSRVEIGRQGILLVRGPNIFSGYHLDASGNGFSAFEQKSWYNTGDFVKEDADGLLTFCGRKKRFIKLAGEMISLPAIENVLQTSFAADNSDGPALAVEATPTDERPEIVLFTSLTITREEANKRIKAAGLSPLHNIRVVKEVEAIPLLGTGKTDYKLLQKMVAAGSHHDRQERRPVAMAN